MDTARLALAVRRIAHPIEDDGSADAAILVAMRGAPIVLIGEASHGTHDFYAERARLTRLLIERHGFEAVAAEADWPDAWSVDRWVRGQSADQSAEESLSGFERFPTWMWRNTAVVEFAGWLRDWNEHHPDQAAGFCGLDLYALQRGIAVVLEHLDRVDPKAAARARARYACFDVFDRDPQHYGYVVEAGLAETCEDEVVAQLVELEGRAGRSDDEFHARQSARLVQGAERYYRAMFRGPATSWNLRDQHMQSTLEALVDHLQERGGKGRVVVWAHNSHLGDARATDMRLRGEVNLGELARRRWGQQVCIIGQTTHHGTVTAARDWGAPAQRKFVRRGLAGSHEELFHKVGLPRFWLDLRADDATTRLLEEKRLQRFIGVIYRPETERLSHYSHASLTAQYDMLLHSDETRAVEPLERTARWEDGEPAETYPSGL